MNDGYWCELSAWPGDLSQEFCLGNCWAKTPRLAVRWLRDQAVRLASALDPQPGEGWARGEAAEALRQLPDQLPYGLPDPGVMLRAWEKDWQAHEQVMADLLDGCRFLLTTRDVTAYYLFSAQAVSIEALRGHLI
jgi:hypothetical protein